MVQVVCLPMTRLVTYQTKGSETRWQNAANEFVFMMKKKQNR